VAPSPNSLSGSTLGSYTLCLSGYATLLKLIWSKTPWWWTNSTKLWCVEWRPGYRSAYFMLQFPLMHYHPPPPPDVRPQAMQVADYYRDWIPSLTDSNFLLGTFSFISPSPPRWQSYGRFLIPNLLLGVIKRTRFFYRVIFLSTALHVRPRFLGLTNFIFVLFWRGVQIFWWIPILFIAEIQTLSL